MSKFVEQRSGEKRRKNTKVHIEARPRISTCTYFISRTRTMRYGNINEYKLCIVQCNDDDKGVSEEDTMQN